MKKSSFYLISLYYIQVTTSVAIPRLSNGKEISTMNKTEIDKLVLQQTEAIKKIVSDRQQVHLEYPQEEKSDIELKEHQENTTEVNLDELRLKCEHLEKLIRANNSKFEENGQTDIAAIESAAANTYYRKKFPLQTFPVYFQGRKDKVRATTPKIKGFYITSDSSEGTTSATIKTTNNIKTDVKYIKLEPVILQKTYLTNGKIVYYWHKSLPSAMHYANSQQESEKRPQVSPTTQLPTTSSSSYSFRNFFPFYALSNSDSHHTTTESTTTTTITSKVYSDFEDLSTQLRFVVPVPYLDAENSTRDPWYLDQFAYYQKPVQQSRVKVQVPYVPTFHVIKALAVPNQFPPDNVNRVRGGEKSYSNYGPTA